MSKAGAPCSLLSPKPAKETSFKYAYLPGDAAFKGQKQRSLLRGVGGSARLGWVGFINFWAKPSQCERGLSAPCTGGMAEMLGSTFDVKLDVGKYLLTKENNRISKEAQSISNSRCASRKHHSSASGMWLMRYKAQKVKLGTGHQPLEEDKNYHAVQFSAYDALITGAKMKISVLKPSISTCFCLGTSDRCRSWSGQSLAGNWSNPQNFNLKF
eukprot:183975-Pelagomonas_calceolata.AAC.6